MIDEDLEKKLRIIQSELIRKGESTSFSKVINQILREGLSKRHLRRRVWSYMEMKTNFSNCERVLVQFKFEDNDIVYVKMMTLDKYHGLEKMDDIEYCRLMK